MDYIVNVRREITINNYAVLMNHDKIWRVGKIFALPLLLVGTKKKKCKIGGDLPGRSREETFFHRYPSVETRDIKLMIKIKINQLIKKKKKPHTQNCYSSIYTDSFLCGIDSLIIIKLSYILNTPSSFQSKHTNSSQYLSTCLMEYHQERIS